MPVHPLSMALILGWSLVAPLHAQPGPAAEIPDRLGEGNQVLVVQLRGARPDVRIRVERSGLGVIELLDPGYGRLSGVFRSEPVRSVQLRLTEVAPEGENDLFDGIVMLPDRDRDVVSFEIVNTADRRRAVRVPSVPSAAVEVVSDPRVPYVVGLGWGVFLLGWVGLLVGMWRRRVP